MRREKTSLKSISNYLVQPCAVTVTHARAAISQCYVLATHTNVSCNALKFTAQWSENDFPRQQI